MEVMRFGYPMEDLSDEMFKELSQAIRQHRDAELALCNCLGYPFEFWNESTEKGDVICVSYYDKMKKKDPIRCYQYQKQADGWHWWKRENNDDVIF